MTSTRKLPAVTKGARRNPRGNGKKSPKNRRTNGVKLPKQAKSAAGASQSYDIPDKPRACMKQLIGIMRETIRGHRTLFQRHLRNKHPEIWRTIRDRCDTKARAKKPASPAPPKALPKGRSANTKRPEMLETLNDCVNAITASRDVLRDHWLLRLIVEVLRTDITAAVVLCEFLFRRCRKQRWPRGGRTVTRELRETMAEVSGLTLDQVTKTLKRYTRDGNIDPQELPKWMQMVLTIL